MTKVCIINPPRLLMKGDAIFVYFPVGIAHLASYLKSMNIEVKVIDMIAERRTTLTQVGDLYRNGMTDEELIKILREFKPDYVGISSMFTAQSDNLHHIARVIKKNINTKVIAGGVHVSSCVYDVNKDNNIDYTIVGEGEVAFLDIIQGNKHEGKTYISKVNIRELPIPDYSLFNMEKYFETASPWTYIEKRSMSIVTSRGCPYRCTFCSIHNSMGRNWRGKDANVVLEEIKILKEKYNVEHLFIEDDNITFDEKRATEIFNGMKGMGLTWETPNGIRVDTLTPNLLDAIKASGCKKLVISIESGCQEFLNNVISKKLDLNNVKEVVKLMYERDIDVASFYIFGIPGETKETLKESVNFAKYLALHYGVRPYFLFASPLPNTDMWRNAEKNGYLKKNIIPTDYIKRVQLLKFPSVSMEEMLEIQKKAYRDITYLLLRHPKSLLRSDTLLRIKRKLFPSRRFVRQEYVQ